MSIEAIAHSTELIIFDFFLETQAKNISFIFHVMHDGYLFFFHLRIDISNSEYWYVLLSPHQQINSKKTRQFKWSQNVTHWPHSQTQIFDVEMDDKFVCPNECFQNKTTRNMATQPPHSKIIKSNYILKTNEIKRK